jgi:hypothetical protein
MVPCAMPGNQSTMTTHEHAHRSRAPVAEAHPSCKVSTLNISAPSIFLDKNRCDIGQSQSKSTASKISQSLVPRHQLCSCADGLPPPGRQHRLHCRSPALCCCVGGRPRWDGRADGQQRSPFSTVRGICRPIDDTDRAGHRCLPPMSECGMTDAVPRRVLAQSRTLGRPRHSDPSEREMKTSGCSLPALPPARRR